MILKFGVLVPFSISQVSLLLVTSAEVQSQLRFGSLITLPHLYVTCNGASVGNKAGPLSFSLGVQKQSISAVGAGYGLSSPPKVT